MIGIRADKDKAPIAIAAVDITTLIDLEPDAWMTESRRNFACAITHNACTVGTDKFWLIGHFAVFSDDRIDSPDAVRRRLEVNDRDSELATVIACLLICSHIQRSADPDV